MPRLLLSPPIPVPGDTVALRVSSLDRPAVVEEVVGEIIRVVSAASLGGDGAGVDAVWVADGRLLQAPGVVLEEHDGGAWIGIGPATVVAGRWLRRSVPAGVTGTLRIGSPDGEDRVVAGGAVRDIGMGGVGIVVAEPVAAGDRGSLELLDRSGDTLGELAFEVVHVADGTRGLQAGCRFLSLVDGARIAGAVESLAR
jgi:hypothetical protein